MKMYILTLLVNDRTQVANKMVLTFRFVSFVEWNFHASKNIYRKSTIYINKNDHIKLFFLNRFFAIKLKINLKKYLILNSSKKLKYNNIVA